MTKEDIIRMAREAGIDAWWASGNEDRECLQDHLEHFAGLVAASEHEEIKMTKDEAFGFLQRWQDSYNNLEAAYEPLTKAFGATYEGELPDAVWGMFDAYTELLAGILGDTQDWLQWYCFETEMGKKNMRVFIPEVWDNAPMKNVSDLYTVIEAAKAKDD